MGLIMKIFDELITLNKSYRSTHEIATFSNKIIGRENVSIIDRHGPAVQIVKYSNDNQLLKKSDFFQNSFQRKIIRKNKYFKLKKAKILSFKQILAKI